MCRYDQLSPSMIHTGEWGVGDDRRMLAALFSSAIENEWQVAWDNLVDGRTAAQAGAMCFAFHLITQHHEYSCFMSVLGVDTNA